MHFKLIVFDFDGTLADTRRNIVLTLQQTMQAQQLPVADEQTCAATIGLTLHDSFLRMFPDLDETQAQQCVDTYHRLFDINKQKLMPTAFPHAAETLAWLTAHGITCTVASSRSSASLHELLQAMGLKQYVSHVVGAEDTERPKPAPDPVLITLQAMGIEAGDTLVVGDMPVDIRMGAAAKTRTCGVTYGNASRKELAEAGADFLIDSLAELPQIIG